MSNTQVVARAVLAAILCLASVGALRVGSAQEDVDPVSENARFQQEIEDQTSRLEGEIGVHAVSLSDGRAVSVNADGIFPAASLYKLLVMYRVFQSMESGSLSPDAVITIGEEDALQDEPDEGFVAGDTPTVEEALIEMMTHSSNAAAMALVREVGGWAAVQSAAVELGMDSTGEVEDGFYSTPRDIARFFELLARGQMISPSASDRMIVILLQQAINDRIPALLPPETPVAHKTGELDDVRNDAGIVYTPASWYIIVMMSSEGTPTEQVEMEATLSYLVFDEYGR